MSRSEQTSYDSHLLLTFSNPQIKKQIDQTFKPGVFVQDKKIADKEQSVVCDGSAGGERSQGACSVCWMKIKNGGDSALAVYIPI